MSLADVIRSDAPIVGGRCSFTVMRNALPLEDQLDLDACMADETITSAAIMRGLQTVNVDIKQYTIQRHRKGECRCESR